jgi:hypothetical protein
MRSSAAGKVWPAPLNSQIRIDDKQPQEFFNAPIGDVSPALNMDPKSHPPAPDPSPEPPGPGYQPSTGRKLFMFVLCLVALIAVWVFYWFASK